MDINPITGAMKGAADLIKTFHNPQAKRQAQLALAQEANSREIKLEEIGLERYKAEAEAESRAQTQEAEVTKAALSNRSWWVAGCRPAMVWAGFAVIMMNYVLGPWIFVPSGLIDGATLNAIRLDSEHIWPIIGGTGIMAVTRSHDKWRGVTHK